jgi:hypothetical protein
MLTLRGPRPVRILVTVAALGAAPLLGPLALPGPAASAAVPQAVGMSLTTGVTCTGAGTYEVSATLADDTDMIYEFGTAHYDGVVEGEFAMDPDGFTSPGQAVGQFSLPGSTTGTITVHVAFGAHNETTSGFGETYADLELAGDCEVAPAATTTTTAVTPITDPPAVAAAAEPTTTTVTTAAAPAATPVAAQPGLTG